MYENGQAIGYQSVRSHPSEKLVNCAEKLYLQKPSILRDSINKLASLPFGYRLASLFGGIHLVMLVALMMSSWSPVLIISIGLIFSIVLGVIIGKPWSDMANETKTVFDSPLARKIYGNRVDELGQLKMVLHFLKSEQDTVLYRLDGVSKK